MRPCRAPSRPLAMARSPRLPTSVVCTTGTNAARRSSGPTTQFGSSERQSCRQRKTAKIPQIIGERRYRGVRCEASHAILFAPAPRRALICLDSPLRIERDEVFSSHSRFRFAERSPRGDRSSRRSTTSPALSGRARRQASGERLRSRTRRMRARRRPAQAAGRSSPIAVRAS